MRVAAMDNRLQPEGKIENLPQWAQRHIDTQEHMMRDLRTRIKDLTRPAEESRIVNNYYREEMGVAGDCDTIRFKLGKNVEDYVWIDVRIDEQEILIVHGSDCIAISPSASNSVEIKIIERR